VVDKVGWRQVGRVSEPGRYMFRFGWLTVTADDLAVWAQHPNTVFTLVRVPNAETEDEFHLGAFEFGADHSSSEK
jgi:hypothetical protein